MPYLFQSYIIDLLESKCTMVPLSEPMKEWCLPSDAKFNANMVMGTGKQRIDARSFTMQVDNESLRGTVSATVNKECFPVGQVINGISGVTELMASVGFFNTTMTIRDPKIFDVPQICMNSTREVEPLHPFVSAQIVKNSFF